MVEALTFLARANLAMAAAILVVLALRRPIRRLAGARIAYGLWILPALAAVAMVIPARVVVAPTPIVFAQAQSLFVATPPFDPAPILFALWALGVAIALIRIAWKQRQFLIEAAKGSLGPAVVGVVAPRIIKPLDFADRFTADEQRLVLEHEAAHLARNDSRVTGLVVLIQCVCWFNPLIHIAAHVLRIDQELACDEVVISRFPRARPQYAQALLKAQLAIRPLPLGCYWPSGTQHPLLERIAMIQRDDYSRVRRLAGAGALTLLCAASAFGAWAAQPPRTVSAPAAPRPATAQAPVTPKQTPAETASQTPQSICLTNACVDTGAVTGPKPELAAAITKADFRGILQAGGSATHIAAAWDAHCAELGCPGLAPGTERLVVDPGGNLALAGVHVRADGTTDNVLGRIPNMEGAAIPPGTEVWTPPSQAR